MNAKGTPPVFESGEPGRVPDVVPTRYTSPLLSNAASATDSVVDDPSCLTHVCGSAVVAFDATANTGTMDPAIRTDATTPARNRP
jgi:hypothetical protein